MVRLLMNALKTIPQKGPSMQRAKLHTGFVKRRASSRGASTGELKRIGANLQEAQTGCKVRAGFLNARARLSKISWLAKATDLQNERGQRNSLSRKADRQLASLVLHLGDS